LDASSFSRVTASAFVDGLSFQLPATIGLRGLVLTDDLLLESIFHEVSPRLSNESALETSFGAAVLMIWEII